jgi:hypothetical protein
MSTAPSQFVATIEELANNHVLQNLITARAAKTFGSESDLIRKKTPSNPVLGDYAIGDPGGSQTEGWLCDPRSDSGKLWAM